MFGMFMGPTQFLNDEMVLKSISSMPSNVIDIIELYEVDVKKFFSYSSGLIQTLPLLKSYDFTDADRKILIDYAVDRLKEITDQEEKYLKIFKTEVDAGDYTFIELYNILMGRVEFRKYEGNIRKDLEEAKFDKSNLEKLKFVNNIDNNKKNY